MRPLARMAISSFKISCGILLALMLFMSACRGQSIRSINTAILGPACEAPYAAIVDEASSLLITTSIDLHGHTITVFKLLYISPDGNEVNFGYWMPDFGCKGYIASKQPTLMVYASCVKADNYLYFYVGQKVLQRFNGTVFRADVKIENGNTIKSVTSPAPQIFDKIIERMDVNGVAVSLLENRILVTQKSVLVKYCVSPLLRYTIDVHMNDQFLGTYKNQCFNHSIGTLDIHKGYLLQIIVLDHSPCNRRIVRRILLTSDDTFRNF